MRGREGRGWTGGGRDPQHGMIPKSGLPVFGKDHARTTSARTRMTKRHQAKYKIDRRMGQNIWGRPKSPVNKREYGPGQHGQRRKGKLSDYGVQLRAKQKLKGYYANLSERRLDPVIYRAKLVPTVFAARQFISHGHIKVNGKRVTVASYKVKVGDE